MDGRRRVGTSRNPSLVLNPFFQKARGAFRSGWMRALRPEIGAYEAARARASGSIVTASPAAASERLAASRTFTILSPLSPSLFGSAFVKIAALKSASSAKSGSVPSNLGNHGAVAPKPHLPFAVEAGGRRLAALVVNANLLGRFVVVVNDHFLIADYEHLARFDGGEPVNVDVRREAAG